MQTVDLIASGYEWTCPNCNAHNSEVEITTTVVCYACGTQCRVDEYEHAHG